MEQCVFATRHELGDGEGSASNGGAAALLLWSHGRAEEREMGLVSWLTGALGELKSWPAVPGHPRRVAA